MVFEYHKVFFRLFGARANRQKVQTLYGLQNCGKKRHGAASQASQMHPFDAADGFRQRFTSPRMIYRIDDDACPNLERTRLQDRVVKAYP
ncbi:hypothetical protein FVF58_23330 [Paraburkholderia panacisoli]|uniref:Uncharacterized protein n=1 Tax=Paraburkholderia panacisoli TaxID=2603818 RepID=A0A5B0GY15_9BURK|nr:hypothetical protein [Paraburkholderia panacisoli]KAA1007660.1 hypothetical protein FVF58_23330 [Paraburkholderia panacisoli]